MLEKSKTIEFDMDGQAVCLTVARANVVSGTKRDLLAYETVQVINAEAQKSGQQPDDALLVLAANAYPAIVASSTRVEGLPWPLSFSEFCNLPDDLVRLWEGAVYEVNPHWNPAGELKETLEKKAETSTPESPAS